MIIKRTDPSLRSKKRIITGISLSLIAAVLLFAGILSYSYNNNDACNDHNVSVENNDISHTADNNEQERIYYSCMTVAEDETLWDISCRYAGENESVAEYIKNIKEMNNMKDDTIYSGMKIMYYYYTDNSTDSIDTYDGSIQIADENI